MKRISLNKEDFKKLTNGEIVEQDDVQIALQDIGYDIMMEIIYNNFEDLYK